MALKLGVRLALEEVAPLAVPLPHWLMETVEDGESVPHWDTELLAGKLTVSVGEPE